MLKYLDCMESFAEVPDEISLYIPLTGCRIRCPQCNSKWLWDFEGTVLDQKKLSELINKHKSITCLCLGGGHDYDALNELFEWVKTNTELKTCWYTGLNKIPKDIKLQYLDFIKVGSFQGKPINEKGTNQRMYEIIVGIKDNKINSFKELNDVTYKFWK